MAGKVNKKSPSIEGLSLITGDNTQSKSNGTATGYCTTTGTDNTYQQLHAMPACCFCQ
jgi:hypothetical protein